MEIKSKEIKIVDISILVENPKNNNIHPEDQIERLAKLIKYTGFRNPLVVSNRSGFVLCGHGRISAARKAGLNQLPVIYQDFKDEAEEYQYMTADNAIHNWSSLDLTKINSEMLDFGPDFDIDMLGLKEFDIEPMSDIPLDNISGDIDFSNEIDEKNDYVVLLFKDKENFEIAKNKFNLKTVKQNLSKTGIASMETKGIGRIVDGDLWTQKL